MERRDVLRIGLAGVSTGVAACARAPIPPAPPPSIGVDDFLHRMDHGRSAIAGAKPLSDLLTHLGHETAKLPPTVLDRHDELFRKSIDALFLTASFRDLSRDEQLDPRVQKLMWGSMDDINDAVTGISDHLDRLSDDERRAIGDKLAREPDLALGVFETIDGRAAKIRVDPRRRAQLRSLATQAGWRLRTQPVALFVDEQVAKVRKIAERQHKELLESIATAPPPQGAPQPKKAGQTVITVGAILLGCSLVIGAIGFAIASGGNIGGAFLVTAGVLGVIGGLITLLVGAIISLSS